MIIAMIKALISAGMGPSGRSVYLRDPHYTSGDHGVAVARALGARTVFVHFGKRDRSRIIEAHGGGWLWGGPSAWAPGAWRSSLETCLARVKETGASGIMVDPENGWPAASDREAVEFGAALKSAARETRIGLTSYPTFPKLEEIASECRGWIWGSPQLYGQTGGPADWAIWHERWARELGAGSVVASVAAGPGGLARPRPYHFTFEGMRSYLTSLPSSAGGVLWPGGFVPQYVSDAVSSWEPGGSALGTLAYTIRDALVRPGAAAILAIVALLSILFSLVIL